MFLVSMQGSRQGLKENHEEYCGLMMCAYKLVWQSCRDNVKSCLSLLFKMRQSPRDLQSLRSASISLIVKAFLQRLQQHQLFFLPQIGSLPSSAHYNTNLGKFNQKSLTKHSRPNLVSFLSYIRRTGQKKPHFVPIKWEMKRCCGHWDIKKGRGFCRS